jgi:hypothetical protein
VASVRKSLAPCSRAAASGLRRRQQQAQRRVLLPSLWFQNLTLMGAAAPTRRARTWTRCSASLQGHLNRRQPPGRSWKQPATLYRSARSSGQGRSNRRLDGGLGQLRNSRLSSLVQRSLFVRLDLHCCQDDTLAKVKLEPDPGRDLRIDLPSGDSNERKRPLYSL